MNSCQKGKRGERELRDLFRQHGFTARRTQQYCGNTGEASDVEVEELPGFHIESKRVERGNPYDWIAQVLRDKKPEKIGVVAHKRNNHPTIWIMDTEGFFAMLRESGLVVQKGDR